MMITSFVVLASITITGAFSSYTQQLPQAEMFGLIAKYALAHLFNLL